MRWQVLVPHIGPRDNLEGCIASMKGMVVPVLVVDNSKASDTQTMNLSCDIEYHPENLGVAASWNRGLAKGADYTLLLSASMRFNLSLSNFIQQAEKVVSEYGLDCGETSPFHCFVVGRKSVDAVGTFDENYYPAEGEDLDWAHRMRLAGLWKNIPRVKMPVTCVGSNLSGPYVENYSYYGERINAYWLKKWGSHDNEYALPFGDKPLTFWEKHGRV